MTIEVIVRNNNVEKVMRVLKKEITQRWYDERIKRESILSKFSHVKRKQKNNQLDATKKNKRLEL